MSLSFSTFNPTGYWEGTGADFNLLRERNNTKEITGKLTKFIRKYEENVYIVTDTYYNSDGIISFGPIDYLIDINEINGESIESSLFNSQQNISNIYSSSINQINLYIQEQSNLFINVNPNINTSITNNKIVASGITENDFPNLEFVIDNSNPLDFTDLKIFLNVNDTLEEIDVPGIYYIVKSNYDAAVKEVVTACSAAFEPFKCGIFDGDIIGKIVDEFTNNKTYGIPKLFSITLTDTSMSV
jgi:hypothetical protein